jgi:MFS family permease
LDPEIVTKAFHTAVRDIQRRISHRIEVRVSSRFRSLWRHPDFLRLWTGETISIFGTLAAGGAVTYTAILWLHASALEISVLAACQLIPGFVVALFAGVWVDRLRRRPVMIVADIGRAVALGSIPFAALFDVLTLPQLYLTALITGTFTVFFDSAYQAYLPTLVAKDCLIEANAKLSASASVAETGGFGISGWLVQLFRAPGAVLVDAVSFLFSAFFVWRIRTPEAAPTPVHERESFVREAVEGASVVAKDPYLRAFAFTNLLQAFSTQMLSVTYLLYLVTELGFNPGVLGMIFAIGGLTSLGGAWLANRVELLGGLGRALAISVVLRSVGMLMMPLAGGVNWAGYAFLVVNQLISDPFWTLYNIHDISIRQSVTPESVQGRMFANFRFLEFGAALLGAGAGGLLGQAVGLRETLFLSVALSGAGALVLLASPVVRLKGMPGKPALNGD